MFESIKFLKGLPIVLLKSTYLYLVTNYVMPVPFKQYCNESNLIDIHLTVGDVFYFSFIKKDAKSTIGCLDDFTNSFGNLTRVVDFDLGSFYTGYIYLKTKMQFL